MNEISEKYKKFIIEIKINKVSRLFITGMDISKSDDDFVLVDPSDNILMFENIEQIIDFVEMENDIIDARNFKKWAQELIYEKPYISFDLDRITQKIRHSDSIVEIERNYLSQILDLINIIGDYTYQVKDNDLTTAIDDKPIEHFKEFYMDTYIWDNVESDVSAKNLNFIEFKISLGRLIIAFTKHFVDYII
jgi:hypothetical protein